MSFSDPTGHIRAATIADLPSIVAIYNQAIPGRRATADTEPISVESRQAWFAAHTPDRRPLWVWTVTDATGQSQILGWIGLQDFYGRPAYAATAEFSLYVAMAAQGQGIGRSLLQALIQYAPQCGVNTLLGFVFGHNEPSLRLCHQLGFEQWGFLPSVAQLDKDLTNLVILGLRVVGTK
jgi:L-amino acid N-acyltransferase YncA